VKKKVNQKFNIEEFKKIGVNILRKWYFLIISLIITLSIAYVVNRYSVPIYSITSSLSIGKFDERKKSPLDLLDGDRFFDINRDVDKECVMLKSLQNIHYSLKRLDFDISYYNEGNIKTIELYPIGPIKIFYDTNSHHIPYNVQIKCILEDTVKFQLTSDNEYWNKQFKGRSYKFNKNLTIDGFTFSVSLADKSILKKNWGIPVFCINNLTELAERYRSSLRIGPSYKGSTVVHISLTSPNPTKDMFFLNSFLDYLVEKGLLEKRDFAVKTIAFLEDQIAGIGDSLNQFSSKIENLKVNNWDKGNSEKVFEEVRVLEQQKVALTLKIKYLSYLNKYIKEKTLDEPFSPYYLGIDDAPLNKLFDEFSKVRTETIIIKKESNKNNPFIKDRELMLGQLEKNMQENIINQRDFYNKSLFDLEAKINKQLGSIKGLLSEEREMVALENMFNINKELYTSLFEKRIEANIAKVSTSSDYEIIDYASCTGIPITPLKSDNNTKAVILGLLFPMLLIALFHFMNDKVIHKDDLLAWTDIPLLGSITHSSDFNNIVVLDRPKSIIAESFRGIRSNLQYIFKDNSKSSKVILITSSVSGEGKTFCAINFSFILASSNKKTILIGADLRKPKMYDKLDLNTSVGLSTYLADAATLDGVIQKTKHDNLDVITAGEIPPNPAELLMSKKVELLIEQLKKQYDFIVFDTPPIGLVSDSMAITKFSDVVFFIVRQNYSKKDYLLQLDELYREKKIENVVLLFNDVTQNNFGYGYGYGYGHGYAGGYYDEQENDSWIMNLYKKLKGA
jgi:capsular exopolysaccharide synthesis family protein